MRKCKPKWIDWGQHRCLSEREKFMRQRRSEQENTSFQEHAPYDPRIDIQTDVAMVYGLDRDFLTRLDDWRKAGYIPHVMTGVSWGAYQDYVNGTWDGQQHYEDAQAAVGD